ncbi:response regulator [Marinicauda algicola]|uniref:Regulatory protein VirG n=1 Tax=Marinicauda algicola TaxID=2029849 RepID=A0A4S2H2K1_9PROT|nr:response regulator [Marinicauda algicola]TGY89392.1 response regulator [Marinicauda algicola]
MMARPNILIVDDDAEIRQLVSELVKRHGMQAFQARDVAQADMLFDSASIDLVILDVMMPGEDGTSFCRRLRSQSGVPIIMLTALGEEVDRIVGLEMGADDYLPKPFSPRELMARIKNILRRAPPALPGEARRLVNSYRFEGLQLDPDARTLFRADGSDVGLTSGEFALLLTLVERAPRVLSRDQLLDLTRGAAANPFDRSIDAQVSRLRRKLKAETGDVDFIKTVRNIGYAFSAKVESRKT